MKFIHNQYKCPNVSPPTSLLNKNFAAEVAFAPPQVVAPTQTLIPQQEATAQTTPAGQSLLVSHVCRPAHGVLPSTQKPVPSAVLAQTQVPPGPQGVNVSHVSPVQVFETQALLMQIPEGHCRRTVNPHIPPHAGQSGYIPGSHKTRSSLGRLGNACCTAPSPPPPRTPGPPSAGSWGTAH